jgi:hypothetical protein
MFNVDPKSFDYLVNGVRTYGTDLTYEQIVDCIDEQLNLINDLAETSLYNIIEKCESIILLLNMVSQDVFPHITNLIDFVNVMEECCTIEDFSDTHCESIDDFLSDSNPYMKIDPNFVIALYSVGFDCMKDLDNLIFFYTWKNIRNIAVSRCE